MSLTQTDLKEIKNIVNEELEERVKNIPTKDEFFNQMDQVMSELVKIRENQEILVHKVYEDHEERLQKVEEKVGIQSL